MIVITSLGYPLPNQCCLRLSLAGLAITLRIRYFTPTTTPPPTAHAHAFAFLHPRADSLVGRGRRFLAGLPWTDRRRTCRFPTSRHHLERAGEHPLEDGRSRQSLVVARGARQRDLGHDRRRNTGRETRSVQGRRPGQPGDESHVLRRVHRPCLGQDRARPRLGSKDNPDYCHPFNSYASSTPYIEKGRLYPHFGSNGTWCIDTTTGKTLWKRRDLKCNHFRGDASSPVVYGDIVYLIFDGFDFQYVAALDTMTGKTVWKTDRNIKWPSDNGDFRKAYATPALFEIDGKPQLICPSAECTIAYDPKSGVELWRISHGGMNGEARPVMGGGLLYLTSGHSGKLLALKPPLLGMVPKEAVSWQVAKGVPSRPSLLLDGGLLFMVGDNGVATCLDASSGKVYWSERLDGEFSASPILAGKNIYCCNESGKTFVLSASTTFNVVAENRLDNGFMASPAVAGDDLILRTRTHLYCVSPDRKQ